MERIYKLINKCMRETQIPLWDDNLADMILMYAEPNDDDLASYEFMFLWVKHLAVECERKGLLKMLAVCVKNVNSKEKLPGERMAVHLLSNRNSKLLSLNVNILQQFLHFQNEHPEFPSGRYLDLLCPTSTSLVNYLYNKDYTKMRHKSLLDISDKAFRLWMDYSNDLWIQEAAVQDWLDFCSQNDLEDH